MFGLEKILSVSAALAVLSAVCQAQSFSPDTVISRYALHAAYMAPEKVYLHIDRTTFCPGETIWFSGYVTNPSKSSQLPESNYIYVELLTSGGELEHRAKVRRDGSTFPGYILVGDDVEPGNYILRAYTRSQLDFPQDYMFHQSVRIVGAKPDRKTSRDTLVDVTFYPEGGRYFAGVPARIGFKAMTPDGRSASLEGTVVDGAGDEVAVASTRHDGMGEIRLVPSSGMSYFLKTPDGRSLPLPAPSDNGAAVGVSFLSGRYFMTAYGVGVGDCTLLLRNISGMHHVADFSLLSGMQRVVADGDDIDPGINHLLLLDAGGHILSERLFFKYADNAPTCTVGARSPLEGARTPVDLDLSLAGGFDGVCSVSVLRASVSPCVQDDGIDSYMMLSSELRGAINNPRHYFDQDIPFRTRSSDMDLLMMVQGWTMYDMDVIMDPSAPLGGDGPHHTREYTQSIKGHVSRLLSSKAPSDFTMTVMIPSTGASTIVHVDEGRRFVMDSLDFEERTGMIIKIDRAGKGADYIPSWDGDDFAGKLIWQPAPGMSGLEPARTDVEYVDPSDTLKAAYVVADRAGLELGINGRSLPRTDFRKEPYMTLVDYLQRESPFYFDGTYMHNRRKSLLSSTPDNWDESPVKLLVNGMESPWDAFSTLTLEEISGITISTEPDQMLRALEGVVAVTLDYGRSTVSASDMQPSMLYFVPLGCQVPHAFYSPRYDIGADSGDPDHRNTIHWEPQLNLRGGHASLRFCTSDDEDYPYYVHVEGLTSDGTPFSASSILQ